MLDTLLKFTQTGLGDTEMYLQNARNPFSKSSENVISTLEFPLMQREMLAFPK